MRLARLQAKNRGKGFNQLLLFRKSSKLSRSLWQKKSQITLEDPLVLLSHKAPQTTSMQRLNPAWNRTQEHLRVKTSVKNATKASQVSPCYVITTALTSGAS